MINTQYYFPKWAPDGVLRDGGIRLFCLRDSRLTTTFRGIRISNIKQSNLHTRCKIGPKNFCRMREINLFSCNIRDQYTPIRGPLNATSVIHVFFFISIVYLSVARICLKVFLKYSLTICLQYAYQRILKKAKFMI